MIESKFISKYDGEYKINEAYRMIANGLKGKFKELEHVPVENIIFLDRMETEEKKLNKKVLAKVSQIPKRYQGIIYQLTGTIFTFMIEVFLKNISYLTREQKIAVIYHELRHLQLVITDKGPDIKIVGHHVEDWYEMIDKLGATWTKNGKAVPNLLDESIVNWSSIENPQIMFEDTQLKIVK